MIDDRTSRGYPLPHKDNLLVDDVTPANGDVSRIRLAFTAIDADIGSAHSDISTLTTELSGLETTVSAKAKADLSNVDNTTFAAKMTAVGGGGASVKYSSPTYVVSGGSVDITGQMILAVEEQIAGTTFAVPYTVEGDYVQEDAAAGTDQSGGTFTLHGTAGVGGAVDAATAILLHGDGAPGDTIIVDGRGIAPFGNGAGFFDGASSFKVPPSSKIAFGSAQNFTYEFWFRLAVDATCQFFDTRGGSSTSNNVGVYYLASDRKLRCYTGEAQPAVGSTAIDPTVWHHVALVRATGVTTLYVDGQVQFTASAGASSIVAGPITIGMDFVPSNGVKGWLANFRVSRTSRYTAAFTPPTAEFTTDADTVYLFKFSGGHGSQVLLDSSKSGHDIACVGSATISSATAKFGTTSLFTGNATYSGVRVDKLKFSSDLFLGADDFTIDFYINFSTVAGTQDVFAIGTPTVTSIGFQLASGTLRALASVTTHADLISNVTIGTPIVGTWHHVAVTRSGASLRVFFDGALALSASIGINALYSGSGMYLSIGTASVAFCNAHVDEFRVKRGVAEWTAAFTPPTAPYTADDRTVVLLHFNGVAGDTVTLDSSESSYTTTGFGDSNLPRLDIASNAAGLSTTYTRGGHGTSMALNGSQYATLAATQPGAGHPLYFATGEQWCVEGWFHITSLASEPQLFQLAPNSGAAGGDIALLYSNSAGNLRLIVNAAVVATTTVLTAGWRHIAAVRDARGYVVYIDGVAGGSPASPYVVPPSAAGDYLLRLGAYYNGTTTYYFTGAIDQFRITHGKARYTANFTPTTLSPDVDTALMWTFDGSAGQKWVKERSGNTCFVSATGARQVSDGMWISPASTGPTIDTTRAKFGGSSLAFGGSSRLRIADGPIPELAARDWTIDGWFYVTNVSGSPTLLNKRDGSGTYGPVIASLDTAGNLIVSASSNGTSYDVLLGVTLATGFTANAWHHLALVRSGTTLAAYLDGTRGTVRSIGTVSLVDNGTAWTIGAEYDGTYGMNGNIDEFRITVGTDRGWTGSTIPVPTTPYGLTFPTTPYFVRTTDASRLDLSAFSSIDSASVSATLNPGSVIRYALSFDGRSTWLTFNSSAWNTIALNSATLIASGMDAAALQTALLAWTPAMGTTVDIVAVLKTTNPAYTPIIDAVSVTMDEYSRLVHGTDFTVTNKKLGSQRTSTFKRVKSGNANHVFYYV